MAIATDNRTDAQIQSDVLAELKWEPRVKATEIGVAVKDGVVTLTGCGSTPTLGAGGPRRPLIACAV